MSELLRQFRRLDPRVATAAAGAELARAGRESKSLRLAFLLMLGGLGWWVFAPSRAPKSALEPASSALKEAAAPQSSADSTGTARPKRLAPTSPAIFRLGAGFCGGFLVGFLFRRFLRLAALVTAAVFTVITLLKWSGLIDLDWASIETHVRESLNWTAGRLAGLKNLVTGYLPSAFASAAGVWNGLRWRAAAPPVWDDHGGARTREG